MPLYWEAELELLTLDVRRWADDAVLAVEVSAAAMVVVEAVVAAALTCCLGYDSDAAGVRERKPLGAGWTLWVEGMSWEGGRRWRCGFVFGFVRAREGDEQVMRQGLWVFCCSRGLTSEAAVG